MKISCQSCDAKYTIADEKVVGKVVKIKCKKCGSTIVVNGNEVSPGADAGYHGAPADGDDGEGATRVFGAGGDGPAPGGGVDEWTVNVTDDDQRTMTTAQIAMEYQRGLINDDTYVWKDGMADWLPLSGVQELASLVGGLLGGRAASAPAPAPAPAAAAPMGLGGTVMMDQSPAAAPLAASAGGAARRAGGRGAGVDLFGGGGGVAAASEPLQAAAPSADKHVGERNENSVLFSLSALTATENAAKASSKPKGEDAVIDMGPSRSGGGRNNGRAGFDDIMNLGGGGIAGSPVLAPPPLLAPVVEAPPPPPPVSVAPAQMGVGMPQGMMMPMAPPAKKGSAGLIIGIVLGLAVVGGAGFFFLRGQPTPPPVTGESNATAAPATAAPMATAPAPDTAAVANTAAPAETAAPADTGAPVAAGTGATPAKPTGAVPPTPGKPDKPDKREAKPTAAPTAEKPPEEKKPEAPPPGGAAEFNRGAASAALGAAAGAAKGCKKADGPTGSGKVRVTFAPSGNVTSATVQGAPFAGTSVGGCIASAFRGAHVPPFSGDPVSVTKSFSIN